MPAYHRSRPRRSHDRPHRCTARPRLARPRPIALGYSVRMIDNAIEPKIRVVLADDHAVLRAGLKALLNAEPDIEVVGEAPDGAAAVDAARLSQPDVIVMDIQMPRMSGLDATRAIRQSGLKSKVLILTMHAESQYLLPLLEAGGSGYVLKAGADTELIEAIRTVHRGEVFLYPAATKLLVISPKTVDTYRERIMQKLGVRHRYELVKYALRKGMLKAE